jgi:hypothetical protein
VSPSRPRRPARALLAAAGIALVAVSARDPQATPQGPPAPAERAAPPPELLERAAWEAHRTCVASERLLRFLARYGSATPELRARAALQLGARRPLTAGIHWTPGVDALRRAESVIADSAGGPLSAEDSAALDTLDALGGALDLVAVPGAFEAVAEGPGEPVTAVVRKLHAIDAPVEFVLELAWRSPSDEIVHARREPVAAAALEAEAFEMYLRAPATGPGPWRLSGLVRFPSGTVAATVPEIRVDALPDLRERANAAMAKTLDGQPGLDHLRELLARLIGSGRRASTSLGAAEMLFAIEAWSETGPPRGLPVPIEAVFTDARHVEHWLWSYAPEAEPVRGIVVLAPSTETADLALSGEVGRRWIELAETSASQLFALHLPPDPGLVVPLLERLRRWVDGGEVVVVARGDALGRLLLGLSGGAAPPFDAVAISGVVRGASPSSVLAPLPRLVVAPGASEAAGEAYRGLEGAEYAWLNELALPVEVGRWLEDLGEARAADGGEDK